VGIERRKEEKEKRRKKKGNSRKKKGEIINRKEKGIYCTSRSTNFVKKIHEIFTFQLISLRTRCPIANIGIL
jgi:hypothetical protein